MFKKGQKVFLFYNRRWTGVKHYRYGVIDKNQDIDSDIVDVRFDDKPEMIETLFYGLLFNESDKQRCEVS